ncbi:Hypothetical predicted protein [Mytilus galloprovincialis]|uniref:CCHC-type domain-containing protein n=1 Tax=Mytilus galloprovincialis TaxID=29158 RepID=A0A8B6DI00_MYTGA|nr:Hypothetical predicted protein [Mytilus galloprovincialis]
MKNVYGQAESRALKTIKEKKTRGKPYSKPSATVSRPANSTDTSNSYYQPYNATQQPFPRFRRREATPYDTCYECHQTGHFKRNCPKAANKPTFGNLSKVKRYKMSILLLLTI